MGMTNWEALPSPWAMAAPKRKMAMNFWPSWAPCMKAMAAPPATWALEKKRSHLRRFWPRKRATVSLAERKPSTKPRMVERKMP